MLTCNQQMTSGVLVPWQNPLAGAATLTRRLAIRRSTYSARRDDVLELFGPVDDATQAVPTRSPLQHDEPAVAGHVIVRDRDALAEVVVVSEEHHRLPETWFGAGRGHRNCHHVLTVTIENLTPCAAPARLYPPAFRHLPLAVQRGISANVDLVLS